MELVSCVHCSTITERLNQIRQRVYLEKISGISATSKEDFIAFCRQYEQKEYRTRSEDGQGTSMPDGYGTDQDVSSKKQRDQIHWNSFGDWNNYAPDYQLQPCTHNLL